MKRDIPALIEALRIRALALTGEKWERGATQAMMKEAAQCLEDLREQRCEWTEDEDGNWATACGEMFCFIEAGPVENGMHHCPYCGAALVPVAWARREP